eukprot:TRINITY_DN1860_c0_g1_i1.p1 TRINITY_DN1860_c0_g1~~TRINITY_DN1860_c0_g1_i1.p1  ORF type:complete len:391 (+),score=45.27 TRINITY_DN1860_c0_g1_i1:97-1269(+)
MSRWWCVVVVLVLVPVLAADAATLRTVEVPASAAPGVWYEGRVDQVGGVSGAVRYDWPCVTLNLAVTGASTVSVVMDGGNNEFVVLLNGRNVSRFRTTDAEKVSYPLVSGLNTKQSYNISMVKITEASYFFVSFLMPLTTVQIRSLSLTGDDPQLLPRMVTASKRRIEVFSDSDSNGFGIDGPDDYECLLGLVKYENCYQGYASLLAQWLNAEVHIEAWSGKGVVKNAVSITNEDGDVMPVYWNRTIATEPKGIWNFQRWVPDAIIVLLGSNDYYSWPYPTDEEFISGYIAMLHRITAAYNSSGTPQPVLINLCGGALANNQAPCPNVQKAVSLFAAQQQPPAPKAQFILIGSDWLVYPQDFGCLDHRNAGGQVKLATRLAPLIRRIMNW